MSETHLQRLSEANLQILAGRNRRLWMAIAAVATTIVGIYLFLTIVSPPLKSPPSYSNGKTFDPGPKGTIYPIDR